MKCRYCGTEVADIYTHLRVYKEKKRIKYYSNIDQKTWGILLAGIKKVNRFNKNPQNKKKILLNQLFQNCFNEYRKRVYEEAINSVTKSITYEDIKKLQEKHKTDKELNEEIKKIKEEAEKDAVLKKTPETLKEVKTLCGEIGKLFKELIKKEYLLDVNKAYEVVFDYKNKVNEEHENVLEGEKKYSDLSSKLVEIMDLHLYGNNLEMQYQKCYKLFSKKSEAVNHLFLHSCYSFIKEIEELKEDKRKLYFIKIFQDYEIELKNIYELEEICKENQKFKSKENIIKALKEIYNLIDFKGHKILDNLENIGNKLECNIIFKIKTFKFRI